MINLEYLRRELGLQQHVLARRAGMCQPEISLIETGRLLPRPDELERLARVLGVSPSVLMREVKADLEPTREQIPAAEVSA